MSARGTLYFHLLTEDEIRNLKPVLEILRDERETVLTRWYELYRSHFEDTRTLSEPVFREVYGKDLDGIVKTLLQEDMEGFEADVRGLGYDLLERNVPFAEVVASLHLFEESSAACFQSKLKVMLKAPHIYLTFDKLSHCRMILLAGTYFAGHDASVRSRLNALEAEATALTQGQPSARLTFHGLVGRSPGMRRLYEQIAAAAGGHGAVFIVGESGTGKEVVARALHECSGPIARPFIAVNCAALTRELIESELFGHKRGSYTGAQDEYAGLIRAAADGTMFLDEITEMAGETQAKLLRVLEERTVRPIGGTREIEVQCRFVASSNRDPEAAVEAKILRHDLYFRLSVHRLQVPPLRERIEDIPELTRHFLDLFSNRGLPRVSSIDAEALEVLSSYSWPGNVRELRNAIEYALTVSRGDRIRRVDLPAHVIRAARGSNTVNPSTPVPTMEDAERDLILRALDATGGNKVHAARMLRISRHRLYDKLKKFGVELNAGSNSHSSASAGNNTATTGSPTSTSSGS